MKTIQKEALRFTFNLAFAIYNCFIGISSVSVWFLAVGAYYIILSIMRVSAIVFSYKNKKNQTFVMRFSGIMLFIMALVLCVIVYMTIGQNGAIKHHEITMITIATYTFTKLTLAVIGYVKSRKSNTALVKTLRSIAFTDSIVSIYSMQRSMLATFDGMTVRDTAILNALSGIAMCIFVICMGISLVTKRRKTMAKSKLVKGVEKISEGVVSGYKKIEDTVVSGYTKIEDKFVEKYLTHEGESVEDAKNRLKNRSDS